MSSSVTTHDSVAKIIRYMLMSLHVIVWIVTFILSLTLDFLWDIVFISLSSAAGFVLFIYVPAALYLSMRNSPSRFARAGHEIIYTLLYLALTIPCVICAFVFHAQIGACSWRANSHVSNIGWIYYSACNNLIAIGVLASIQTFIAILWLILIVRNVVNQPALSSKRALQVPAHKLLNRDIGSDAESGSEVAYPWAAQAALSREDSTDSTKVLVQQEMDDEALARAMAIKEADDWEVAITRAASA